MFARVRLLTVTLLVGQLCLLGRLEAEPSWKRSSKGDRYTLIRKAQTLTLEAQIEPIAGRARIRLSDARGTAYVLALPERIAAGGLTTAQQAAEEAMARLEIHLARRASEAVLDTGERPKWVLGQAKRDGKEKAARQKKAKQQRRKARKGGQEKPTGKEPGAGHDEKLTGPGPGGKKKAPHGEPGSGGLFKGNTHGKKWNSGPHKPAKAAGDASHGPKANRSKHGSVEVHDLGKHIWMRETTRKKVAEFEVGGYKITVHRKTVTDYLKPWEEDGNGGKHSGGTLLQKTETTYEFEVEEILPPAIPPGPVPYGAELAEEDSDGATSGEGGAGEGGSLIKPNPDAASSGPRVIELTPQMMALIALGIRGPGGQIDGGKRPAPTAPVTDDGRPDISPKDGLPKDDHDQKLRRKLPKVHVSKREQLINPSKTKKKGSGKKKKKKQQQKKKKKAIKK